MKQANIKSRKLEELEKNLLEGNKSSLEAFYDYMKIHGTPLVEEIEGDLENFLVTFIYQDKSNLQNISIVGDIFGGEVFGEEGVSTSLSRLLDTDLYYCSYIIKKDAKSLYVFGINDDGEWYERLEVDPLNSNIYETPIDSDNPENELLLSKKFSLLTMPEAKRNLI